MNPVYALLLIPVWGILLFIEYRRPVTANLIFRALAITTALTSLSLLLVFSQAYSLLPHKAKTSRVLKSADTNKGLLKIGWANEISIGDSLIVSGEYVNHLPVPIHIYLSGFGLNLDSCIISPGKISRFTLETLPKITGHFAYHVYIKETVNKEELGVVPVEVSGTDRLHILILNSSPSFENRYLKDWLSMNKNSVAMRSLSSNANYQSTYQNRTAIPLEVISSSLLAQFDLLITDNQELKNLPVSELQVLIHAISEGGLGLIIQEDSLTNTSLTANLHSVPLQKIAMLKDTLSKIKIAKGFHVTEKIPLLPLVLAATKNASPLFLNERDEILSNVAVMGKGKFIQTVINRSYSWLLQGDKSDYSYLWSTLLNTVARKKSAEAKWVIGTRFPRRNTPVSIDFITPSVGIPSISINQDSIRLRESEQIPQIWTGKYWPLKPGWLLLMAGSETSHWFYVYSDLDWLMQDNQSKQYEKAVIENPAKRIQARNPLLLFIYFLAFIVSLTYLWLENKF